MNQSRPRDSTIAQDVKMDSGENEIRRPHETERAVMMRLQSHPSLRFSKLKVHQYGPDSICVEGLLVSNDAAIDLCDVVRGIHGIKFVVNRVVNTQCNPVPEACEDDECEERSEFHD